MKALIIGLLSIIATSAHAGGQRIYQQDSYGNIQYHKPSYTVQENGRIIETDPYGNRLYHKQQYQVKDGKVYPVDSTGNIQYHKPSFVMKP